MLRRSLIRKSHLPLRLRLRLPLPLPLPLHLLRLRLSLRFDLYRLGVRIEQKKEHDENTNQKAPEDVPEWKCSKKML